MSLLPEKLPDSIDNAISNISDKPTKEIGNVFDDLLYAVFGKFHFKIESKRIIYQSALEELSKAIKEKMDSIPLEYLIMPNTQKIWQALEDSKYCVENKDIREMFENLITSTMDSRSCDTVHPTFSGILKQMTSKDAKFLMKFCENEALPICKIISELTNGEGYIPLYTNVYMDSIDSDEKNILDNALILSALSHLGLIEITYYRYLVDDNAYNLFSKSIFFRNCVEHEERGGDKKVSLQNGLSTLTPMGEKFLQVCCSRREETKG